MHDDSNETRKKNIFQSKIEKVFIELPNYSFSHSSSNRYRSIFIGRKDLVKRLKDLVLNSSTKTGVYLITGNRGVGKSSLISEVMQQTSITSGSWSTTVYLFLQLCIVIFLQLLFNFLRIYNQEGQFKSFLIFFLSLFCIYCLFSLYRRSIFHKRIQLINFQSLLYDFFVIILKYIGVCAIVTILQPMNKEHGLVKILYIALPLIFCAFCVITLLKNILHKSGKPVYFRSLLCVCVTIVIETMMIYIALYCIFTFFPLINVLGYSLFETLIISLPIILFVSCIIFLCESSFHKKKQFAYFESFLDDFFTTIMKEFEYYRNSSISPRHDQTIRKIIFFSSLFLLLSLISKITCFYFFLIYFFWVSVNVYYRFIYNHLIEKLTNYITSDKKNVSGRGQALNKLRRYYKIYRYIFNTVFFILLSVLFLCSITSYIRINGILLVPYVLGILVLGCIYFYILKEIKVEQRNRMILDYIYDVIFGKILRTITTYYQKHNHVFLNVNLGHAVLHERDVLVLIAHTVSTEFVNYYKSLRRTFLWRFIAFILICMLTFIIYKAFYEPVFKDYLNGKFNIEYKSNNEIKDLNPRPYSVFKGNYEIQNDKNQINKSIWSTIGYQIKETVSLIDKVFTDGYNYALKFIPYLLDQKKSFDNIKKEIQIPPYKINYPLIIIFLFVWGLSNFFLRCKYINIITPFKIKKAFKELNDIITSEISNENLNHGNWGVTSGFAEKMGISFTFSKRKKRSIADEREIERELSYILNNIQHIPSVMRPPQFVIVFDELDKVEPENNEESSKTKGSMFSLEAIRDRQSTILKLLINLKFFLTNAKAKFIFIAGREMYDIYLADISDRNNFIGSIFHDVINVDSFLSDYSDEKHDDLTTLTEEFVCRFLIPASYKVAGYSLNSYIKYLDAEIFTDQNNSNNKLQKRKIVAMVQQFILYLAYVSKGAPKKMVQQFESFILIVEDEDLSKRLYVKNYANTRYFLAFDYQDQYAIGMIAYLINPFFLKMRTTNVEKHSDKLVVSSLFTLDFLYKYHDHSFSWKDLTSSPEMLEINKAPELNPMINELINFLSQFHLEKSTLGFNDFRFDNLISQEISFLSKIYEDFSAIFNFSLDESLSVKQYYQKLLDEENKKNNGSGNREFSHAISSLNVRLGDLYFYDDELEQANTYYKNGIQKLRNKDVNILKLDQLQLLVKNMMKLGFVYEKRKLYDFAFLTYGELTKLLIHARDIDIYKLGLSARVRNYDKRLVFIKSTSDKCKKDEDDLKYEKYVEVPNLDFAEDEINEKIANVQPLKFERLSSETQALLFKNSTFEGLKMLYLPLLAKFQILEKSHFGGIKLQDLEELIKEFRFMKRMIDHQQRNLLIADFYSRVGDILFYKNSCFNNEEKQQEKNIYSSCFFYKRAIMYIATDLGKCSNAKEVNYEILKTSIGDVLYKVMESKDIYKERSAVNLLARVFSDWGDSFLGCDLCSYSGSKNRKCHNQGICPLNTQSFDIDFLKACSNFVVDSKHERLMLLLKEKKNQITKFETILVMYSLSSYFYKESNLHKRSAFQLNKILIVFKNYMGLTFGNKEKNILLDYVRGESFFKEIVEKAIHSIYLAYDDVNLFEINKRKKDFGKKNIPLRDLLLDSKIDRLKIIYKEIELKYYERKSKTGIPPADFLKQFYNLNSFDNKFITSRYEINYSVSSRIFRLRFKAQLNWMVLSNIVDVKSDDILHIYINLALIVIRSKNLKCAGNVCKGSLVYIDRVNTFRKILNDDNISELEVLERLVVDTIFCYKEMIRLSKTSGESYFFNHSFFGSTYYKLKDWTCFFEIYNTFLDVFDRKKTRNIVDIESKELQLAINDMINNCECENFIKLQDMFFDITKSSKIKEYMPEFLDENWTEKLSSYYDIQQALSHYYKTEETHSNGRAYYNIIEKLYYLKDDYNDRMIHFEVGLERSLISTGVISRKIEELKNSPRYSSTLHDPDRYL